MKRVPYGNINHEEKKQMKQERLSKQWEPTTFLAVRLSLGKHKEVLIKSLPTPCAPETIASGRQGM